MAKTKVRLTEAQLHKAIMEAVKITLKESFEDDYNAARDEFLNRKSPSGMFGMELKNTEGEWEYGDVRFDPKSMTMSCMNATINVDPDMSIDDHLQALYDELINQGYTDY